MTIMGTMSTMTSTDSHDVSLGDTPPLATIAVACVVRNEAEALKTLLRDITRQTYPHGLIEVILVNSSSSDHTAQVMKNFARSAVRPSEGERFTPFSRVTVIENESISLPTGVNKAIQNTTAESFVRIDAHARIPADFLESCVKCLNGDPERAVCGGRRIALTAQGKPIQEALVVADESAFGAQLFSQIAYADPGWVNAVFHGCYRMSVFRDVGTYDERLWRSEEADMSYRLKKKGYRVYFDPRIVSYQITRSTLAGLLRQRQLNGFWMARTLFIQPRAVSFASLIPACLLGILLVSGLFALVFQSPQFFVVCVALYLITCFAMSIHAASQARKQYVTYVILPAIFVLLHAAFGFGTWQGFVSGFFSWLSHRS